MKRHDMTRHVQIYDRTYGYGQRYKITCSCGYDTGWNAREEESFEPHRQSVIAEALGLKFTYAQAAPVRVYD